MKTLGLKELCDCIGDAVAMEMAGSWWVCAEIASLTMRGGHGYLELVEKGQKGLLQAKVRATCWSSLWGMLQAYFAEQTGMPLQVGMQVLVEVEVNYHAVYGLSLNIVGIDPQYTMGDLQRQREQTIRRLQEDGVWDMQRSLTLPTLVKRIAVVSSAQAAGYEDFIHQLAAGGFGMETTLFEAVVQGDGAEKSILQALNQIASKADSWDAVVIIRGGGSSTDLGCFDSYEIASHCAQFPLPILTGIGHTKDVSIVDMVVHLPLKTPTAVAAFLIDRMAGLQEQLTRLRQRLQMTAERQILIRKHQLDMLRQRLEMCNPERIYKMGYSVTTVNGKVIRSQAEVAAGQRLVTCLADGEIISEVVK